MESSMCKGQITSKAEEYSVIDIGHQIKKYIDSDA